MWEKNKKYYAKAIDLHQRYGYGSRRIAYVIPVHERTIRRWFTKFAQENVQPQQTMNAKKRNKKQSPLVDSPASVTEQMTSVEVQGLQVEKKRLLAQLRLLEKKTKKLEEELLLEQIRSEGYLMMLELEQDDKEKHKRKKDDTK